MFIVVFFKNLNKKNAILISSVLAVVFISLFSSPKIVQKLIPSFKLGKNLTPFEKKQIIKPSYYEYNYYHSFKIGNLRFNVSKKYTFSIDTPIPAISESFLYDYQKEKIFPQLIDKNNLKKGFIWKKLNAEEKKELDKSIRIIEKSYLETSCERL
jgi:hypothetical protein